MATYNRSKVWLRARARVSQVAECARVVEDAISAIPVELGEFDTASPPISIGVQMPGVKDKFDNPDDFVAGAQALPLNKVKVSISGHTHHKAASQGTVYVFLGTAGGGVTIVVEGSDRRWVEGTFAIVKDAVEPFVLKQSSRPVLIAAVLLIAASQVVGYTVGGEAAKVAALAVASLTTLYIFATVGWLGPIAPTFRLLPDDAPARMDTLRRLGGVLVALAIGAILTALATRWLG